MPMRHSIMASSKSRCRRLNTPSKRRGGWRLTRGGRSKPDARQHEACGLIMTILKERRVTLPELFLIGGDRLTLRLRLGLPFGRRGHDDPGKSAGVALFLCGASNPVSLAI